MSHTARFWVYHSGLQRWDGYFIHGEDQYGHPIPAPGSWVKLSLRVGDEITIVTGGPHEEGYSWTYSTYSYRNGVVTCDRYTNARDCDGPLETWSLTQASINSKHQPEWTDAPEGVEVLNFNRVSSRQRDHYAEAMGY